MALITYIESDGTEHKVNVEAGLSVMQGAVDNLIEGIAAECGGSCSCATCHCYVDESWIKKTKPADEVESDMIQWVVDPKQNSRLSCQIQVIEDLDGLIVHLPKSQY